VEQNEIEKGSHGGKVVTTSDKRKKNTDKLKNSGGKALGNIKSSVNTKNQRGEKKTLRGVKKKKKKGGHGEKIGGGRKKKRRKTKKDRVMKEG